MIVVHHRHNHLFVVDAVELKLLEKVWNDYLLYQYTLLLLLYELMMMMHVAVDDHR
jgi:hypothetical protein